MEALPSICDVLVVGSGNAGFSAALAAKDAGAERVIVVDKCPEEWAGGNTYFTAGAMRTVHSGLKDLLPIVNNVDDPSIIDLNPYTRDDFMSDMLRVTDGRCDPKLSQILVDDSNDAIKWLAGKGIRYQLSFNRQAYKVDGRYKFWGGLALKTQDGGKGLVEDHIRAAKAHGIDVYYSTAVSKLVTDPITKRVSSVSIIHDKDTTEKTIKTGALILAAGGFEANPEMRTKYLGQGWQHAHVRGTPHNTGDLLQIAMRDVNARPCGDWRGCHSTCWDANAPYDSGNREISNEFTKSGYPLGLMINVSGKRFVDEGIDMRNYTYAKFGRAILEQDDGLIFQVYDGKVLQWLRDEEYRDEIVEKIYGDTIEQLAEGCSKKGLKDTQQFLRTIEFYNEAVYAHRQEHPEAKWNPAEKDGLSTQSSNGGLELPKSNWALPLDNAPFMAVRVGCGVTFTFGGLSVNPETAAVVTGSGNEVPGLYCVGEMMGGLFHGNYPGGSGLTSGTVFGRRAGTAAAELLVSCSN